MPPGAVCSYFNNIIAMLKPIPANTRHNVASSFSPNDTRMRTSWRDAMVRRVVMATPIINKSVVTIKRTATVVSFMVMGSTLFRVIVLHRSMNSAYVCNETRCSTHAHAVNLRHLSGNNIIHHTLE